MIGIGLYAKIAAALALCAAIAWGSAAIYSAGKRAGQDERQAAWDKNKADIQRTADVAIAQATKDKEAALAANEAISNDYQTRIDAANANAANFAQRLRNALATTATRSGPANQAADNPEAAAARAAAVAEQLGQVVGLTAGLYADCKANADQLDALIAELKPQL